MTPQQINEVIDLTRRIQAMVNNPHWTTDRRWRIGEYAEQIEKIVSESTR